MIAYWPSLVPEYIAQQMKDKIEACWKAATTDAKKMECKNDAKSDKGSASSYVDKLVIQTRIALDLFEWIKAIKDKLPPIFWCAGYLGRFSGRKLRKAQAQA